ncbi:hypothetical protein BST17_24825 [Mycolicibacterium bacteremicum]|uniref:HNH endonuclease n=1 Tax=Mycolicibacterium bacteremicum TaxID=564198 RepID=A0A1W9YQ75_MYCBA|nr:hypothetical protein BST17_24825 [Mycolicibacterium bacteremicum]
MAAKGFTPAVKAIVYERAGGLCERCGNHHTDVQYHHRRPRGSGGSRRADTNLPANCLLLGASCHHATEMGRTTAYEFGWLVRQGHNPSEVPVFRRGAWVLLDNDGGFERVPAPTQEAG